MEIKSLAHTGFDTLAEAFSAAFADYEVRFDRSELKRMLKRRGFDPSLSFAAFDGPRIVSFTLNGIGRYDGIRTAYDTGTGTLPAWRGQGLSAAIFRHSLPFLREAGVCRYLLEVLCHNAPAVSVYRKMGFGVSREFLCFRFGKAQITDCRPVDSPCAYAIRPLELATFDPPAGFEDFLPSWQNSAGSVARSPEDFVALGTFDGDRLVGYGILDPTSGDLTRIGVDRRDRRQGIGSALLAAMARRADSDALKVINVDTACTSLSGFLAHWGILPASRQFEMVLPL